jgi:hypothetical protein
MFGIIRLVIRIAVIIALGMLILAYFTNPTEQDFKEEVKQHPENPAAQFLSDTTSDFTETAIDKFLVRKNYFICSMYDVHLPFGEYKYLGAYHTFFPLQKENPLDKLAK